MIAQTICVLVLLLYIGCVVDSKTNDGATCPLDQLKMTAKDQCPADAPWLFTDQDLEEMLTGTRSARLKRLIGEQPLPNGHNYQYVVALRFDRVGILGPLSSADTHLCSGFVVNTVEELLILTAAHCMANVTAGIWRTRISVRINTLVNMGPKETDNVIELGVKYVYTKLDWEDDNFDVVILQVENYVQDEFANILRAIDIPNDSFVYKNLDNDRWFTLGYGAHFQDEVTGKITADYHLRKMDVTYKSKDQSPCDKNPPLSVESYYVCALADNDKNGICNGDSGGPLVLLRDTREIAIGVTSQSGQNSCKDADQGAFYIDLRKPPVRLFVQTVIAAVRAKIEPTVFKYGSGVVQIQKWTRFAKPESLWLWFVVNSPKDVYEKRRKQVARANK